MSHPTENRESAKDRDFPLVSRSYRDPYDETFSIEFDGDSVARLWYLDEETHAKIPLDENRVARNAQVLGAVAKMIHALEGSLAYMSSPNCGPPNAYALSVIDAMRAAGYDPSLMDEAEELFKRPVPRSGREVELEATIEAKDREIVDLQEQLHRAGQERWDALSPAQREAEIHNALRFGREL